MRINQLGLGHWRLVAIALLLWPGRAVPAAHAIDHPMMAPLGQLAGPATLGVSGPDGFYNNGDAYSVRTLPDGSPNPNYHVTGYDFALTVPPNYQSVNGTSLVNVEIYDPDCYNSNGQREISATAADQLRTSSGGAGDATNATTTRYSLYWDNRTPDDTSDDVLLAQGDYGNDASTDLQWVTPPGFQIDRDVYAGGNFRINVRTIGGSSLNGFNLRAGPPRTPGAAFDANNGASVSAIGKFCIVLVLTGTIDIGLGYAPSGASAVNVTKFDTDVGATGVTYTCDSMPGQVFQGTLAGNGQFATDSISLPANYSGGNWAAHYSAAQADASSWSVAYTAPDRWTAVDIATGADNKMRVLWTNDNGSAVLRTVAADGTVEVNNTYGPYPLWTATTISVGGDGMTRVLWSKSDGTAALWALTPGDQSAGGGALQINQTFGPYPGWSAGGMSVGPDNMARVLWKRTDGTAALWVLGLDGSLIVNNTYGPYAGWSARRMMTGADNKMRVLWLKADGTSALWVVAAGDHTAGGGALEQNVTTRPYPGWTPRSIATGSDDLIRLLWQKTDNTAALWLLDSNFQIVVNNTYGPYTAWTPTALAAGGDNKMRVLWDNEDGRIALWRVAPGQQSAGGGLEVNVTLGPY